MKQKKLRRFCLILLIALFCFLMIPIFGISAETQGNEPNPDLEQKQERGIEEPYPYTIKDISRRIEIRENKTHILGGAEIGYPPYSIVNDDDQADGFSVELMRAALEIMGYRLSYITGPWSEIKKKLEIGEVEALPLVGRTPEREDIYDFTFPYLTMHGAVVVHKDDTKTRSLDDVKDKRIAVLKGDNAEEYVRRKNIGEEIVPMKTFADALQMLSEKKVDAVVIQRFLALQLMDEYKLDNLRLTGQPIMDFKQSFCFAVREGNKDLLEILNEGLSLVIADGTYDELYTKWFGPLQSLNRDYERIIVGGDNAYPPYEFLNENGEPDGFNTDITRAIAEEIGLHVEISLQPWEQTLNKIKDREIDILQGIFYSPARDREFSFSQPHTVVSYVVVTREGELNDVSSMRDLEGYSLLVQQDDIMHERAVSFGYEEDIISMENSEKTLEALSEGTGDCALVPRIQAAYWINKHGWDNLEIGKDSLLSHDYCFGTLEGNEYLLKEFSEGLAALEASGEYREIYNRWFGVYNRQDQSFLDILKTISYFIIPLIMIIILGIIWTWSLRKKVFKRTEQLQLATDNLRSQVRQKEAAEKTLRESEAKFREYIENASNGIFVTDENSMIVEVNDAAAAMTGFEKGELLQKHVYDLLYQEHAEDQEDQENQNSRNKQKTHGNPENREKTEKVYNLLSTYGKVTGNFAYRRKDGSKGYWTVNAVKLSSNRFLGFTTDISDLKKAESRTLAEKERLNVTLRSIGDGVITTDREGRIIILNRVAEGLTGWTQQEAAGRQLEEVFYIISEKTGKRMESPVDRVIQSGEIVELANHTVLISRQGKRFIIADSGAPIRNLNSEIIGVVLVFRDMTEEYRLQENMQRTAKLDSLGILAGGIAHDFNNLLGGLFGYLQLAQEGNKRGEDISLIIDEALNAYDRAKNLTQQLLTFSRGGKPVTEPKDLGKIIRTSASFALSGSSTACSYAIPEDLWLCDVDENQIGQVIDNLIINAQQAMPSGGTIQVSAENCFVEQNEMPPLPPGEYVRIDIADTGIGMPSEMLEKIFDPFFTTKQKGSGLGLATCYSIIFKHDGTISVDSTPGEGTVFSLYLPRSMSTAVHSGYTGTKSHRGTGRILIMDDEKIIREVAGKMLESMGYSVVEAANGEEAIRLCEELKDKARKNSGTKNSSAENADKRDSDAEDKELFTAAFFDLTIPGGMGGKETLSAIRKICKKMPIFASSGYSEDPIISSPQHYGFTDSVAKPFKIEELAALLEKHLKKS